MTGMDYHGKSSDHGIQPDGRRLWIFSQSQLKQVDTCPERGRRTLLGEMPDGSTDSTNLGTAVHGAIEDCVNDMIDGRGPWELYDMVTIARLDFETLMGGVNARWVKVKRVETVHAMIERCLTTFYQRVLPTMNPLAAELQWGPLTIHEDDRRVIQLRGTVDYVDALTGLADWKTTGREWVEWEHKRWDIQPTVYTWAARTSPMGLAYNLCNDWTWHVMNVDGCYQKITTTRGHSDWEWLKERCLTLAVTLEAELPAWPKVDSSALCGPKYCEAWSICKGAHMPAEWPDTAVQDRLNREDNR